MNNSPDQNHLNCNDECIHRFDIIACRFSIPPSYLEFIPPNLHLLILLLLYNYFLADCFGAAQIWWELAPHYFPADCFEGSSDLAGTGSTLFLGRLFSRQLRFGGNWPHIIFRRIVLEAAQIWREMAQHYFPVDCFGGGSDLVGTGSTLFSGGLF
jgi:hypothetical protein